MELTFNIIIIITLQFVKLQVWVGFGGHQAPSNSMITLYTLSCIIIIIIIVVYAHTMVTRHNLIIILFSYALSSSAAAYVHLPSFSTRTHIIFILAKHLIAACTQTRRDFTSTRVMLHTVFRVRGKSFFTRGSWLNRPWCYARYTLIGRYIPQYYFITCSKSLRRSVSGSKTRRKTIIIYCTARVRGHVVCRVVSKSYRGNFPWL